MLIYLGLICPGYTKYIQTWFLLIGPQNLAFLAPVFLNQTVTARLVVCFCYVVIIYIANYLHYENMWYLSMFCYWIVCCGFPDQVKKVIADRGRVLCQTICINDKVYRVYDIKRCNSGFMMCWALFVCRVIFYLARERPWLTVKLWFMSPH